MYASLWFIFRFVLVDVQGAKHDAMHMDGLSPIFGLLNMSLRNHGRVSTHTRLIKVPV